MSHNAYMDYRPERAAWRFIIVQEDGDKTSIASPGKLEWKVVPRHGLLGSDDGSDLVDEPQLRSLMQAIVNEAYSKLGIAPTGFDAEIGAQRRHLEDMRSLVFESGKPNG